MSQAIAVPAEGVAERAPSAVVAARELSRQYGEGDTAVLALRGVDLDVQREKLTAVMGPPGLGDRRTHRPSELSGGQQQRVAIARALVSRPTVMFADEPTGNLDSTTSGEILELLRTMVESYGQTTVMVTHDPQAAAIAHRILFLSDGSVVRDMGPSDASDVIAAMDELSRR